MKITTKGQYGTRALLEVALFEDDGPVPLKAVAERQQIPLHYLERIVALLVKEGFLKSTRGPAGGIKLARDPQDIKISQVIKVLEGSTAPVECVDHPDVCSRSDLCVMCDIWTDIKDAVDSVLDSVTIQNLIDRHRAKIKV